MTGPRPEAAARAAYEAERLRAAEIRIAERAEARLARLRRPRPDTAETDPPEG